VSQQTTNHSFDELTRALAEGSISRRGALRLFAGTAIAALIPSRALADDDDDCVRICHVPFDRATEECDFANAETRCVSRRERRRHLENHPCDCRGRCANCLASCPPDTKLCNNGQCANCCDNADCIGCATCQSGTCACPSGGTVLANGTCARPCTPGACPTGFCYATNEGAFCASGGSVGNCLGLGNGACPTGSLCAGPSCLTVTC
jgi:hypothetical protein